MNPPTQVEAVKCECCEERYYQTEGKFCDICHKWQCPHCMEAAIHSITQEKEANVCRLCLDEIEKINKADVKANNLDYLNDAVSKAIKLLNHDRGGDLFRLCNIIGQVRGILQTAQNQVKE